VQNRIAAPGGPIPCVCDREREEECSLQTRVRNTDLDTATKLGLTEAARNPADMSHEERNAHACGLMSMAEQQSICPVSVDAEPAEGFPISI
jgi:hypothetical protein